MPDAPDAPEHSIAPAAPCPICGKPAVHEFRPFCSKRCADVDLHRWLAGVYAIPVKEDAEGDGEAPRDERTRPED
jgi:uncharacterized protein